MQGGAEMLIGSANLRQTQATVVNQPATNARSTCIFRFDFAPVEKDQVNSKTNRERTATHRLQRSHRTSPNSFSFSFFNPHNPRS